MCKSFPKVQDTQPAVGKNSPIVPTEGYAGCVLVNVVTVDGDNRLRIVAYVSAAAPTLTCSYEERVAGNSWVVDLPKGFRTKLDSIRTAIAHGPGKPNPVPPWS